MPTDLVSLIVKREIKFSDLYIYNLTTEYTDKIDSLLKSARNLKVFRSSFRQIFPKAMLNDTTNEIESI